MNRSGRASPRSKSYEDEPAQFPEISSVAEIAFDGRRNPHNVTANRIMAIKVHIPGPLRDCCAGASELSLSAANLRAVLEELERRYPALHRSVCDDTGAVRRHINLFVNNNHMRDCNGLDTSLAPGDTVTILPAVSGG